MRGLTGTLWPPDAVSSVSTYVSGGWTSGYQNHAGLHVKHKFLQTPTSTADKVDADMGFRGEHRAVFTQGSGVLEAASRPAEK
jgi:hypothetical protein